MKMQKFFIAAFAATLASSSRWESEKLLIMEILL